VNLEKLDKLKHLLVMQTATAKKLLEDYQEITQRRSKAMSFLREYHDNPTYFKGYKYKGHDESSLKDLLAEEQTIKTQFEDMRQKQEKANFDAAKLSTLVRRLDEFVLASKGTTRHKTRWFV